MWCVQVDDCPQSTTACFHCTLIQLDCSAHSLPSVSPPLAGCHGNGLHRRIGRSAWRSRCDGASRDTAISGPVDCSTLGRCTNETQHRYSIRLWCVYDLYKMHYIRFVSSVPNQLRDKKHQKQFDTFTFLRDENYQKQIKPRKLWDPTWQFHRNIFVIKINESTSKYHSKVLL